MRNKTLLICALMAGLLGIGALQLRAAEDKETEAKEGNEVKVKIDQVPAAVRKTLDEESHGAKIDEVDKQTDEGKTIYEADVKINGRNYEIKVAEDGTLIQKKLDEGEDKKKDEEKNEKDEKK